MVIPADTPLDGSTLAGAEVRRRTGVIVVAIKRPDGTMVFNPDSDLPMKVDETVVLLGRQENVDQFREEYRL